MYDKGYRAFQTGTPFIIGELIVDDGSREAWQQGWADARDDAHLNSGKRLH